MICELTRDDILKIIQCMNIEDLIYCLNSGEKQRDACWSENWIKFEIPEVSNSTKG